MRTLTVRHVAGFQNMILAHYRACGRKDLIWRKTRDPYRILVSEFMLQQTQVARVAERFSSFVGRFPDFDSLARSPLRDVLKEWSGLGYNRRALQIRDTARLVVSRFGGALPRDVDGLCSLPGVGPATAGAVMNFAFGEPRAFIETNIRAVFIHHFFPCLRRVSDAEILPFVERTLDAKNPRRWFYALMDYGVTLKKAHVNPSRRSAHHAKQGRFEGSDRQVRGLIVRSLAERSMSETELAKITGVDPGRIRAVLPGLARDGLIVRRGKRLRIE